MFSGEASLLLKVRTGMGVIAISFVERKEPLKLLAATTVMIILTLSSAVIWIFSYLEPFKIAGVVLPRGRWELQTEAKFMFMAMR
jgi:hypothetical protein